jgi:hypothetical protein
MQLTVQRSALIFYVSVLIAFAERSQKFSLAQIGTTNMNEFLHRKMAVYIYGGNLMTVPL